MEFDTHTTPVSDEERRLAENKKLTLEPLHADIAPEPPSDSEIATRHIIEPAISNVANDIEQNEAPIQPSQEVLGRQPSPVSASSPSYRCTLCIVAVLASLCVIGLMAYLITVKA